MQTCCSLQKSQIITGLCAIGLSLEIRRRSPIFGRQGMQCVCKHEQHAEGYPEGGNRRGKARRCVMVFKGFEKSKRRYSVCTIDVGSNGYEFSYRYGCSCGMLTSMWMGESISASLNYHSAG